MVDWTTLSSPRQALGRAFKPNGAIYIARSATFLEERCFYTPPVGLFEMSHSHAASVVECAFPRAAHAWYFSYSAS